MDEGAAERVIEPACPSNGGGPRIAITLEDTEGLWTPERLARQRALRAAILIDAIRCLMGAPGTSGARQAALRWVLSHDARAPFSFRNVCESLGFDPSRIRRALLTPRVGVERPPRMRRVRSSRARGAGSVLRPTRPRNRRSAMPEGRPL